MMRRAAPLLALAVLLPAGPVAAAGELPDASNVDLSGSVAVYDPARSVGKSTFAPELIDVENLKEYSVVTTSGGSRWSSSDLGTKGVNGSPMTAYAWFAAPEDDIDAIDVRVTEFWPTFTDVPITR